MRVRSAAVAGAVALVAGGGVGYAVSLTGSSGQKVVATAPLSGSGSPSSGQYRSSAGAAAAPAIAVPAEGFRFTPLFNRQANGVDIRGFLIGPSAGGVTPCGEVGPRLQAELSTQKMVGVAGSSFIPQQLGPMILTEQPSVVGEAEGDPVAVVVVQTSSSVSEVRMAFTGGSTDSMAPVKGWSVLAAPMPGLQSSPADQATIGTLTALDSSGRSLASSTITWPPALPAPLPEGTNGGSVSASGSGTASSGTSIAGSAGSGIASYPCAIPPPTPPPTMIPTCVPPTTVQGQVYACPMPAPALQPTSTVPKRSGG